MLLADSFTEFMPPFSAAAMLAVIAAAALATLVFRKLLGPANAVSRRWSLWGLRGAILAVVGLVLLNPVRVDELPGPVERPEMFYLFDTSASMQMGSPKTRWNEILEIVAKAHDLAPSSPAIPKAFRFGQRLAAVEESSKTLPALTPSLSREEGPATTHPSSLITHLSSITANEADTRLLSALRQISSRFGRVPPLGIVTFSDGRAHDEVGIEQLAAEFARLQIPIHVVPVGDVSKGGDVAVAAVVAPQRARKYTEVEVQVFLRSYGFDGKRSEVQLLEVGSPDRGNRQLASLPVTLQSGFQSVSLSFRTDLSTRKLRVVVPTLANEVSDDNNQVDTEMAIDRTKLRVLYVEGSPQPLTTAVTNGQYQLRGPFVDFKQALVADEDIECVAIVRPNGLGQLVRVGEQGQLDRIHGFPATMAELAAFDCIVLSNVSAEAFADEQLDWIEPWIGQRGGGLCMIGGENSFASGGWGPTKLGAMLPVELLPAELDWTAGDTMRLAPELPATPHPIWELLADAKQNRQIVSSIPGISGLNRWAGARANLTTVLATVEVPGASVPNAPVDAPEASSVAGAEAGQVRSGDLNNVSSAGDAPAASTGASPGSYAKSQSEVIRGQALPQPPESKPAPVPSVAGTEAGRVRSGHLNNESSTGDAPAASTGASPGSYAKSQNEVVRGRALPQPPESKPAPVPSVAGAEAGRVRSGHLKNASSAGDAPAAPTGASPGSYAKSQNDVVRGQALPQPPESKPAPAIVVGRYGRGRTAALAFPITPPYAGDLVQRWGQGDNRYYAKFCRNLIYWLTENSAIGRRRLVASADKRFYRPGETIAISAATYDESAAATKNYRVVAMVEPHGAPGEVEPETSPLRWPSGMPRTSGEEDPFVVWGEEFEVPLGGAGDMNHAVQLPLAEVLSSGTSSQSLRVELTAYEDFTQIDSTSLDIQVLHDPFEQQNPFPNHDLLERLAAGSGGKVLRSADDLAQLLNDVPADVGPPIVRREPLWSNAWLLGLLIGLLTIEWCWRRAIGLA